jgi:geranylgeranyl pyrophosphate synthase
VECSPHDNPIQRYFENKRPEDLDEAIETVRSSPGIEEARSMARSYANRARRNLDSMASSTPRDVLDGLIDYVVERQT